MNNPAHLSSSAKGGRGGNGEFPTRPSYRLSARFPPVEGQGADTFRPPKVALTNAAIWAAFVADERKRRVQQAIADGDLSENAHLTPRLRWYEPSRAHRIAARVMVKGGWVSPTEAKGLWVPYCENPRWIWHETRASQHHRGCSVGYFAPCRRCELCLKVRATEWKRRIRSEILEHDRSWFGTLTFDEPTLAAIRLAATARGGDQSAIVATSYRWVQLYLKRLRKHTKLSFRYFAVAEFGDETDRLHYHLIVHDRSGRLTRRSLEEFKTKDKNGSEITAYLWPCRVTHWRLVRSIGAAAYVSDYLTKSFDIKPHASLGYGKASRLSSNQKGRETKLPRSATARENDAPTEKKREGGGSRSEGGTVGAPPTVGDQR